MWLPLFGDFTFAGSLSWSSACLAWLYREMFRVSHVMSDQISRPLFILQIWVWEHFPFIARTPSDIILWDIEEFLHMSYGVRYVFFTNSMSIPVHLYLLSY
ncbi:Serine/threonine-protein phosphatase 7 long form homolog [Linum perenne]